MFEHHAERHTPTNNGLHKHAHVVDDHDHTATLDAGEWVAIGEFLDSLPAEAIVRGTASLQHAYKLQTSIRTFVDALVQSGFYRRK